MITFGSIKLEVNSTLEEKYLKEIESMCDSIEINTMKVEPTNLTDHIVKATTRGYSIYFTLSTNYDELFTVQFINICSTKREQELSYIIQGIKIFQNKEIQEKMNVINCENNQCPICNSEIKNDPYTFSGYRKVCKNGCYLIAINEDFSPRGVMIFDETIELVNSNLYNLIPADKDIDSFVKILNKIYDKTMYLKENDRYLAKIMEGNK
ncbi:gp461 [Bacillus phage G]|uniref:Gp461 n=1 Tax=Bacillus phage G TaxID=2884420 RepID=G3MAK2_9CAUD|nr:gp461 [Bacillus phage G]AEO93719.1 gp461 [Bacillus phage G]